MKTILNQLTYLKDVVFPIQSRFPIGESSNANTLVSLGESAEAIDHIIDQYVADTLKSIGYNNLFEIHITD